MMNNFKKLKMKKLKHISLLLIAILLASCEEVINVDLPTAEPKLVIEASIDWQLETAGNEQTILLSTSTGYYNPTVPKVSGATVFVTNTDTNVVYDFIENPGTGAYVCTTFEPVVNDHYKLTINYNGETFTATETMTPVVPIDKIEQKEGAFGEDTVEVDVFYTDNGATDDFYMFKFKPSFTAVPLYGITDDEFYQGNQFSVIFLNEDTRSGDTLDITIYGTSEQFSNYMSLLLDVSGGGGPFSTAPAKVKGNIINTTNPENTAFGYFRLSQTDTVNYVVE